MLRRRLAAPANTEGRGDRGMKITGSMIEQSLADDIETKYDAMQVVERFGEDTFQRGSFDLIVLGT